VAEVLGVGELDDPELSDTLSPQDRGILLHASLDDLHQAVLRGVLPQPTHGWQPEHEALLATAYERRADELEARGASGRRALWERERSRRWRELAAWLQIDGRRIAASGAAIVASEVRLGWPEPFRVVLPSGRMLTLRGTIDRIDRDRDGLVVTDHKTGSMPPVKDDDPTNGGRALQLALYAMAAPSLVGVDENVQVRAMYAHVGTAKTSGFTATDAVMQQVFGELDRILAGIDHGVFIADPQTPSAAWGRPPCAACDPDGMGTASAYRRRLTKRADPDVAAYLGAVEVADALADAATEATTDA
jgi:RecB family exonuclease